MARNYYNYGRRYYNRGRQYYYRARSAGRQYYSRARSAGRRANQTIGLYNPGVEYLAGAVLGVTNIDNRIPAVVKILGAALPLRGGIGGKASRFFRGMLIGDAISHYTGKTIAVPGIGDGASSNIKWG